MAVKHHSRALRRVRLARANLPLKIMICLQSVKSGPIPGSIAMQFSSLWRHGYGTKVRMFGRVSDLPSPHDVHETAQERASTAGRIRSLWRGWRRRQLCPDTMPGSAGKSKCVPTRKAAELPGSDQSRRSGDRRGNGPYKHLCKALDRALNHVALAHVLGLRRRDWWLWHPHETRGSSSGPGALV